MCDGPNAMVSQDAGAELEGKVKALDINELDATAVPTPTRAAPAQAAVAQPAKPTGPENWDWGKVPRLRAERELTGYPDGTFLVRASETEVRFSRGVALCCVVPPMPCHAMHNAVHACSEFGT